MASAATRTLLAADVWASSTEGAANRQLPEALGIVRTIGYDLKYQQRGSGFYPSRTLTNQRYHEWELGFRHKLRYGIPTHSMDVNYPQHAIAAIAGVPYVALVANGPLLGNPIRPTATPNAVWRPY